jgi:hypothetical protein
MTRMEELLRAATRESAAEVSPGAIRPLDLSQVPFDRPCRPGRGRWAPRGGWARVMRPGILVPVLAALAVVAVVAASLVVPRVLSGHARPATPSLEVPDGVPPYYVALSATGTPALSHPMNVAVRDTWTGQPLATVTPPPGFGTFSLVAGGAVDDRTWVVGAQPGLPLRIGRFFSDGAQPLTLFRLTFEPANRVIRLTRLPRITTTAPPGFPGAGTAQPMIWGDFQGVALSPDASRLAVAVTEGSALRMAVHVIPLAPGVHGGTWVMPGSLSPGLGGTVSLSWTADNRVLSIPVWKDLIFLDTTKPAGDLLAASRVIPFAGYSGKAATGITYACHDSLVISLDGLTLTCGGSPSTDYGDKAQAVGIVTISARTGVPQGFMPIQRYNAWVTAHYALLYWASPAGARIYIAIPRDALHERGMPAGLTVWRDGKMAGTIPVPADIGGGPYPSDPLAHSVAW